MSKNVLQLKRILPKESHLVDLRRVHRERQYARKVLDIKPPTPRGAIVSPYHPANPVSGSLYRVLALFLIVSINWVSLSSVGATVSYYSDTETANDNAFVAGLVDFELEATPFEDLMGSIQLGAGGEASSSVAVLPNSESNPFFYYASSTNITGDLGFCNTLNVSAELDGEEMYNGSLAELFSATTTLIAPWNFTFTTTDNLPDRLCSFDIDFNGWQERHNYSEYNNGYSDTEKVSYLIQSQGVRINKIYFEKSRRQCGDASAGSYIENNINNNDTDIETGGGGSVDVENNNDAYVENGADITANTGGNSANGGAGGDGGDGGDGMSGSGSDGNDGGGNQNEDGENGEDGSDGNNGGNGGNGGEGGDGGSICGGSSSDSGYGERNDDGRDRRGETRGGSRRGEDYEWVELYNQTSAPVDISGWQICDDSSCDIIPSSPPIPANSFALITGASEVSAQIAVPTDMVMIVLPDGSIGDGLDNENDMLKLLRLDAENIDQANWGDPNVGWVNYNERLWTPGIPAPTVPTEGSALARSPTGFDTDQPSDFVELGFPEVTLLYPDSRVVWNTGDNIEILWEAINPNGDDSELSIDLYYYKDGELLPIALGEENDGSYMWSLPQSLAGEFYIKIIATGPENPLLNSEAKSKRVKVKEPYSQSSAVVVAPQSMSTEIVGEDVFEESVSPDTNETPLEPTDHKGPASNGAGGEGNTDGTEVVGGDVTIKQEDGEEGDSDSQKEVAPDGEANKNDETGAVVDGASEDAGDGPEPALDSASEVVPEVTVPDPTPDSIPDPAPEVTTPEQTPKVTEGEAKTEDSIIEEKPPVEEASAEVLTNETPSEESVNEVPPVEPTNETQLVDKQENTKQDEITE